VVWQIDLSKPMTQAAFGELVGVSQQAVSEFVKVAALGPAVPAHEMLLAYCERLREMAAGRQSGEVGALDLVQERAALAREQRIGQAMKNAIARGEFAPIGALADVLGMASSAVVDRFDQLEGALRKACPDLPEEARATVMQVIASARNEWIRSTARLVAEQVDPMTAADGDDEYGALDEEGGLA
jgi:phage terminase Nu1 subunit (DNA packaging protein)